MCASPSGVSSWPAGASALSGTFQVLDLCLRSAALGLYGPRGSGCDGGCDVGGSGCADVSGGGGDVGSGCADGSGSGSDSFVGSACGSDPRYSPPEGSGGAAIGPGQQQGNDSDKVTVNNGTWQEALKVGAY